MILCRLIYTHVRSPEPINHVKSIVSEWCLAYKNGSTAYIPDDKILVHFKRSKKSFDINIRNRWLTIESNCFSRIPNLS